MCVCGDVMMFTAEQWKLLGVSCDQLCRLLLSGRNARVNPFILKKRERLRKGLKAEECVREGGDDLNINPQNSQNLKNWERTTNRLTCEGWET